MEVNQCDGCASKLPLGQDGLHRDDGHPVMVCQKEKYSQLSDLEIVQKALEMSALVDDRPASLDLLAYGRWTVWNYKETSAHQIANGNDLESLLTWAKQTVGEQ